MQILLLLVLLLTGCASRPTRDLTTQELQAVRVAETFVSRNGYTIAGHPAGMPVQRVSIFDSFESDEELLESRKGLLGSQAIAVEQKGAGVFWVYFPELARKDSPRIVFVRDGEAEQLFHQSYGPPGRKARRVIPRRAPPNNSFKPSPLRGLGRAP